MDTGDDFQIEVTDLRTGSPVGSAHTTHSTFATESGAPAPLVRKEEGTPASPAFARPRRRRRRLIGGIATAAFALAALAILLRDAAPKSIGITLFPPTPTLADGAGSVAFVNSVPWGTLKIDGSSHYDPLHVGIAYIFPRGKHIIEYRALAFSPLRCVFSVPAATSDTCHMHLRTQADQGIPDPPTRLIDLRAVPDALPAKQQQALREAVLAALAQVAPPVEILPGDHYMGVDGTTQINTTTLPITASLAYDFSNAGIDGISCDPFCAGVPTDMPTTAGPPGVWQLGALISIEWRYTLPGGQVVLTSSVNGESIANLMPFDASITPRGTWDIQVSGAEITVNLCNDGATRLSQPSYLVGGRTPLGAFVADNPTNGCLIGLLGQDGTYKPIGYVLYRFGAFIAGDTRALKLIPSLPTASAHEATLASQLIARQQQGT